MKLEWKEPDVEGLVDFLVREKGFMYAVITITPLCPLTVCPGKTACANLARNLQKALIRNNKDASTASLLSSQKRTPLPRLNPRLRVGKTIRRRRVPNGRSVLPCSGVEPNLDFCFQADEKEGGGARKTRTKK